MNTSNAPAGRVDPEANLARLGLVLPTPAKPVAAYIPARRSGSLLFISGQIPVRDGAMLATGRVPDVVSLEKARECARQCALNGLAAAKAELGSLSRIARVVRVGCFVACEDGFGDQPKVANGASELLVEVFGEAGRHARAAVGTNALPLNVPVEVEFLFEMGEG
jgi:enamine deaminase RidA (YjgF/YER057c/UK114 family)